MNPKTDVQDTNLEMKPGADKAEKKFGKGRGHRRGSKFEGRAKPGNDYSYWSKYPELMDQATKFPWMYIAGTEITIPSTINKISFSNVMSVEYVSTIGVSQYTTDPFNLQIRKTWLDMHRRYRGLGAYQQADLGIILFCVKEVFSGLGECGRIYGIYSSYPVKNRILPRGILTAMGYNTNLLNSIETNLADYLYGVNRLIRKARQLCLPKNISVLHNQLGLNSYIYADSKNDRASLIAFKPTGYWHYKATAITSGSAAYLKPLVRSNATTFPTYTQFLKYFEDMIDILLMDDDVTRVCSDLIAAYGDEGTEALVPFAPEHSITPLFDETILLKLHNSEICGGDRLGYDAILTHAFSSPTQLGNARASEGASNTSFTYLWMTQDDNVIKFNPVLMCTKHGDLLSSDVSLNQNGNLCCVTSANFQSGQGYYFAGFTHLLDTWSESPDAAQACESNLWKHVAAPSNVGYDPDSQLTQVVQGSCRLVSCSTEILININVSKVLNSSVSNTVQIPAAMSSGAISGNAVKALCHFDWHPLIPLRSAGFDANMANSTDVVDYFGDVDNVTIVSGDIIMKIHDAALLSGYAIDAVAAK